MKIGKAFLQDGISARNERVNHFISNSRNVQERVGRIYKRDSAVIYPPVDARAIRSYKGGYFLMVTAYSLQKGDLAVEAFNKKRISPENNRFGPTPTDLKRWPGKH